MVHLGASGRDDGLSGFKSGEGGREREGWCEAWRICGERMMVVSEDIVRVAEAARRSRRAVGTASGGTASSDVAVYSED